MKYSLAIDIGASNGRVILGYLENNHLKLQEIHRFDNQMVERSGNLCWDVEKIFQEIKLGIHQCKKLGITPVSIGIDTWAVDFVLLDHEDRLLTEAITYRDSRTDGIMDEVHQIIPKTRLYKETGIQFLQFNTIYQLYALQKSQSEIMQKAESFLMIPDYLHFLLTGKKVNEYTNASTTQLVNATTKNWDLEIIRTLGFNENMFLDINPPKTNLGGLRNELVEEFGFDMDVILPATHDTGSAVLAIPETGKTIYLSSGTWSLMGVESMVPNCEPQALSYNFTNEGGVDGRFRFLKNIMGLWMIQEVRRQLNNKYSFAELVEQSRQTKDFHSTVDVDDDRYLNPQNMITEIQKHCKETKQRVPITPGELAKCIFDSLAIRYRQTVQEIEEIMGFTFEQINVIGGGSQNELLNELICQQTEKVVYAGPVEATAIGNLMVQFIALGEVRDLNEARHIVQQSFSIKKFVPNREDVNDVTSI